MIFENPNEGKSFKTNIFQIKLVFVKCKIGSVYWNRTNYVVLQIEWIQYVDFIPAVLSKECSKQVVICTCTLAVYLFLELHLLSTSNRCVHSGPVETACSSAPVDIQNNGTMLHRSNLPVFS